MPIYLDLPNEKTAIKLADWLEINTLADLDGSTSAQDLKYPLATEIEKGNNIDDSTLEEIVAQAFTEIEKRISATKSGYPFKVQGDKIIKKTTYTKNLSYIFCLFVSYFGVERLEFSSSWKKNTIAKKFENLSANAIKMLLTNDKGKLNVREFGWPRKWKGLVTNPNFINALNKLCQDCGEMKSSGVTTAARMKDAGLDIIAWKKFPDYLSGSVFFWGQCATGDNWDHKLHEVRNFEFFVTQPTRTLRGTFIPHIIEIPNNDPDYWHMLTIQAGMIFDRCRVAYLTEKWNDRTIINIIQSTLTKIREDYDRLSN